MAKILSRLGVAEWGAVVILVAIAVAAVVPGLLAPFDPLRTGIGRPLLPPGGVHLFGTDELGRDVFSRVVWGARISVMISAGATLLALLAGCIFGAIIAVRRDVLGLGVTLLINLVLVFPGVILAIALATLLVPSALTTAIVLSVLYTPPISRLVAATIQAEYGKTYVQALQVAGANNLFILTRAVGKSVAAMVLTFALVVLADAVLLEAALSFIGVGVQAPTPSWGNIVSGGRALMASGRWWVSTAGGLAIVMFALSVNLIGDALSNRKQRLSKPKAFAAPRSGERSCDAAADAEPPLLQVRDLSVSLPAHYGDVAVVDRVTFDVRRGEVLALVGESGSGKSLIAQAVLGLLPRGAVASGSVRFDGRELLAASDKQLRSIRGRRLAFLPQDSIAALNPVKKISGQMALICEKTDGLKPKDLLDQVRLPNRVLSAYPHELSGGQCQRIALAMSLARRPELLVADEPTTALDVSVQAEIFELINDLRRDLGFSLMLISHDLALVATSANRIAVAYGGRVVESGPAVAALRTPKHPYTDGLLKAIRSMERRERKLYSIPGTVPNPKDFSLGCRFAGRCLSEISQCAIERPETQFYQSRSFACHNPVGVKMEVVA